MHCNHTSKSAKEITLDRLESSPGRCGIPFLKLNPRTLMKNPVMFVVEVGAVLTTVD